MLRGLVIFICLGLYLNCTAQQSQRLAVDLLNPSISMLDGIQNNMQIQILHISQNHNWRKLTGFSVVGMNNLESLEYKAPFPSATLTYERFYTADLGFEYMIPLRSTFYASLGGIGHFGRIQYELHYHNIGADYKSQWITGISPNLAVNLDVKWTSFQLKLNMRAMHSWGHVEMDGGMGRKIFLKNPKRDLYQSFQPYVQFLVILPLL